MVHSSRSALSPIEAQEPGSNSNPVHGSDKETYSYFLRCGAPATHYPARLWRGEGPYVTRFEVKLFRPGDFTREKVCSMDV
jgi:hypothetical protein